MNLYNTLSKEVEQFTPINDKKVNIFACGPTVYDYAHIGNGRTAITMDILVKLLKYLEYDVNYLVNITDIDDKIIARADELNISWKDVSLKYEKQYKNDMIALGISIDNYARATDYIDAIKSQVKRLMEKGFAYKIDDGIYFEIAKFDDYGKLSGRREVTMDDAESRVDVNDDKKGWNDFCLWKFKKNNEPSWPADFGEGRPGWHIEDTAITETEFGPQYDIHGGGSDLIFPHHEAELTQMECISGLSPFVKYWVHGGLLRIDGQRMGKSNKNFYTISEVTQKYSSSVIRLFMVQGHYRSELNFSFDLLDSALNRLNRWKTLVDRQWQATGLETDFKSNIFNEFIDCLKNDLDTPAALAVFETFLSEVEKNQINEKHVVVLRQFMSVFENVVGIKFESSDIDEEYKKLILSREDARIKKDYETADDIRDKLENNGIYLLDGPGKTYWTRSKPV